jgi:FixJ family two-component response regulator
MARELTAEQAALVEHARRTAKASRAALAAYQAAVAEAALAGASNTAIAAAIETSAESVRKMLERQGITRRATRTT